VAAAVAVFAVAVPASASLTGDDDGTSVGGSVEAVQSAPAQQRESPDDRPEPRGDRHPCPFDRDGDSDGSSGESGSSRQQESSLPL
jgi:hypothetical protein